MSGGDQLLQIIESLTHLVSHMNHRRTGDSGQATVPMIALKLLGRTTAGYMKIYWH